MKSILDRSFRYTHSSKQDLNKTFARIRREQAAKQAAEEAENAAEAKEKVRVIRKVKSA